MMYIIYTQYAHVDTDNMCTCGYRLQHLYTPYTHTFKHKYRQHTYTLYACMYVCSHVCISTLSYIHVHIYGRLAVAKFYWRHGGIKIIHTYENFTI